MVNSKTSTINRPLTRSKSTSTTSMNGTGGNIKVVVRVRPPNKKEQGDQHRIVIKILDEQNLVFDPKESAQAFFYHGVQQRGRDLLKKANKDLQFAFDRVFNFESTNEQVFLATTQSLIQSLMNGYNCSVFAYGATGAGKTHTMVGNNDNPGITYLTMAELFKAKDELSTERDFELGITYLEVYNELVQDLLNPGPPLQLREDGKYGVTVAGIKVHKIAHTEELFTLLEKGNANRTQHPTDANAESSRSHAVFQVYIQMEMKATKEVRAAKLSMIDLAGSERGAATGFVGSRFTEGANINKSLLALGNCINSLADGQRHVPYRDSKLTRLLKDSLGGNCQTVMIAAISPSSFSYEDTYNTLKYATRAKKIKSHIKRNIVNVELKASQYIKIVEDLKKENELLKLQLQETKNLNNNGNGDAKHVEANLANQLIKLYSDKRKVLERIYNIDVTENVVCLRRKLTEEANSRFSNLCTNTPEKEEGHNRLCNTLERFQRQEGVFKTEIDTLEISKFELENKIGEFLKKHPNLKQLSELENSKLQQLEYQHQTELLGKKVTILEDELKSRSNYMEKMTQMLQSYYLQIRGHGFASDTMIKNYQDLIRDVQGRKTISWSDGVGDSGLGSSTTTIISINENRPKSTKRKMDDDNLLNANDNLDGTFVLMAPPKPKTIVCADQFMAKVYKDTPPKKLARTNNCVKQKENKPHRLPLGSTQASGKNAHGRTIKSGRPMTATGKPPFRR